jgi:hypothetical protein
MPSFRPALARVVAATLLLIPIAGCETGGQTGAAAGAGIGALIGQAAGGDTEATLIGAGVGAGVGYIIGNEADKKKAKEMEHGTPSYTTSELHPLAGTRWQVVSIAPKSAVPEFTSMIIEFEPSGLVETTITRPDGTVDVNKERYRVVGQTVIINRPDYIINAKYDIDGEELIFDSDRVHGVLRRLR